ncbi:hypothetical protein [Demequina salsinemoris]|uniref:hypothetical protein n=1 Tax=Demequina salsinemoris TaxID=577470 RepID=UPI0007845841|nr:hypothetical protein [Demequina salsinemoris]
MFTDASARLRAHDDEQDDATIGGSVARGAAPATRRESCSWINVLGFALALAGIPVGPLLYIAPLMSVGAVALGVMGVRAAARDDAGCAALGYAAVVLGAAGLGAVAWLLGPSVVALVLHPGLG